MDGSNKRMGNIKRQSAAEWGFVSLVWVWEAGRLASYLLGTVHEPAILYLALPILIGFGLIVTGFALMVSGADPFDEDTGGFRENDDAD